MTMKEKMPGRIEAKLTKRAWSIRSISWRISQAIFQRKNLRRSVSCNFQISFQKEDGVRRELPVKSLFIMARYAKLDVNWSEQEGGP